LGRTEDVTHQISKILREDSSAVSHFFGLSGMNFAGGGAMEPNAASFWVSLKSWGERDAKGLDINHVVKKLEGQFSQITNARILVIPSPTLSGFGTSSGFSFILEQRSGENLQQFDQVLNKFLAAANKRPEIGRAYDFYIPYSPQYHVEVDRDKCRLMGVQISDVFSALSTYMGGAFVNDFTRFEREFHVLIQADTAYRANIGDLSQYYVKNSQGQMVPLSALVDVSKTGGPPVISHYNLYRSTEVDGNAAPGYSSGDAIKALEEVAAQVLPPNFGYEFSNISLQEIQAGNKTLLIFMLSILFVFLLLVALYESWSVPFSILLTVPVALFGAILALWVSHQQNSVYVQIGLICLIGLAAKNAILIVEYAKERVDRGVPLIQATLIATKLRFRPILMTSFAFIFGVLPLCLATGAGAASRLNIGFTVVGGMLVATLLGIFTVPTLYVLITRWSYGRRKLKRLEVEQAGSGDGIEEMNQPVKD
ncbi:MAG: efflux RND transporter permease subunit, partial [Nitrosotalea sp.]